MLVIVHETEFLLQGFATDRIAQGAGFVGHISNVVLSGITALKRYEPFVQKPPAVHCSSSKQHQ